MSLPHAGLVFLLLAIATSPSLAESANPSPPSRAQSMIDTFVVMCTLELPDFERIDAKATVLRMRPEADSKLNTPGDTVFRNKSWIGNLTTGPFVLLLDETTGRRGRRPAAPSSARCPTSTRFAPTPSPR